MKNDLMMSCQLVKRGTLIFLKDKATVFFSLLAPLIVLLLYVLFLGDIQMNTVTAALPEGLVDEKILNAFVNGWMVAGVISVACITVSFSANNVMIQDKQRGILNDIIASPAKPRLIRYSYLLLNFIITISICVIVLVVVFIYLAISGWYLSAGEVFAIIGVTVLSILSSSLISVLICSVFKTESTLGAFVGIMSAAIGFLVGAYMPLSMFPKAIQYLVLFIPGTYSAGVFRNLFTQGATQHIANASPDAAESIRQSFSMDLDFFGTTITASSMLAILATTVVVFLIINIVVVEIKNKKRFKKH